MNRLLAVLGILALVAGFWLVAIKPPGHVPRLDANRIRLAETEVEGYASGFVFWDDTNNAQATAEIRAESAYSDEYDLTVVLPAFCLGAQAAGFQGSLKIDCEDWMVANEAWPTYNGNLSYAWNDAFPYPYSGFGGKADIGDDSRTGEREEIQR